MNLIPVLAADAVGALAGFAAGYLARRADVAARVLGHWAAAHGGAWYEARQECRGCGQRRHLMIPVHPIGLRCRHCAGGARHLTNPDRR